MSEKCGLTNIIFTATTTILPSSSDGVSTLELPALLNREPSLFYEGVQVAITIPKKFCLNGLAPFFSARSTEILVRSYPGSLCNWRYTPHLFPMIRPKKVT
jgi:hypothetical protein